MHVDIHDTKHCANNIHVSCKATNAAQNKEIDAVKAEDEELYSLIRKNAGNITLFFSTIKTAK